MDPISVSGSGENMREMGEERNWALAAYGLFLIAPASSGVTALIGVILAHLRLDVARGGFYESHYLILFLVFWDRKTKKNETTAKASAGPAGGALTMFRAWPSPG